MWLFLFCPYREKGALFDGQLGIVQPSVGWDSTAFLTHLILVFVSRDNSPPCFFLFFHKALVASKSLISYIFSFFWSMLYITMKVFGACLWFLYSVSTQWKTLFSQQHSEPPFIRSSNADLQPFTNKQVFLTHYITYVNLPVLHCGFITIQVISTSIRWLIQMSILRWPCECRQHLPLHTWCTKVVHLWYLKAFRAKIIFRNGTWRQYQQDPSWRPCQ